MDLDLKKLYVTVLNHLCGDWIYNCDGGCYWDIAQRKILKSGPWTFTQQPKKGMPEYENSDISLFFTHKDQKTISPEFFQTVFLPVIQDVNQNFEADFRKLLEKTGNQWLVPLKRVSVEEILQIETWAIADDLKRIRSLQTLRGGDWDFSCRAFSFGLPYLANECASANGNDQAQYSEYYASFEHCKCPIENE